jgi:hypothetical protein
MGFIDLAKKLLQEDMHRVGISITVWWWGQKKTPTNGFHNCFVAPTSCAHKKALLIKLMFCKP